MAPIPPSPSEHAPSEPGRLIATGEALLRDKRLEEARQMFERATRIVPDSAAAWRGLGNALHRAGQVEQGGAAHLRALAAAARDPVLVRAANAMQAGRLSEAYPILRDRLQSESDDIAALRMMAHIATASGHHAQAFRMLARAVTLAPEFTDARALMRQALWSMPHEAALAELHAQLKSHPGHRGYRHLEATLQDRAGNYAEAIILHRAILAEAPDLSMSWLALGHVLETTGDREGAVDAYRRALSLDPGEGEAWWSLANIKAFRFGPAEITVMQQLLAGDTLPPHRRMLMAFALGKALEDKGEHEASFGHYAQGNRLKRATLLYDHGLIADQVACARALYTPAFFSARAGQGDPAPDPIFIVGLPRSGSTLVEQILAGHPAIEGTMELPDLPRIAMQLDAPGGRYPEALAMLDAPALAALGATFLAETRLQRKTARPYFLDKQPANFLHIGLIRTILPNARIIDMRRGPMACGFSCYRQHFATGFAFANDLADIGHYYRAYVELMQVWDEALPGAVHRIDYEALVADTETEVRRLLAYLDLPHHDACLRFHENGRSVRTPSASQVRQPVYRDALESWRHYEPWLGPLRDALGDDPAMPGI